jgi:HEAT repeat protein
MLTAKEDYVREMAAKTLGKTGPAAKQAIPSLIERLHDEDEHVRAATATALGEIAPTDKKGLIHRVHDESMTLSDVSTFRRDLGV